MNVRDWCHVEDNCTGIDLVLRQGEIGQIYNIAAGNETANRHLTEMILEILGADSSMIEYVDDRLGHDRRYAVTTDKLRALGWVPHYELRGALAATVRWYVDNRWWWEPLKRRRA
jgi:dTDP-glucose 4,6-dehydratase